MTTTIKNKNMVNINTVYQKVLAIANKEKRGYITPQEFNLFADQAQKEIFEQYFYYLYQFKIVPSINETIYADTVDILQEGVEKIRIYSLRSFGESLYHSLTDSSLEFGYKNI